MVPIGGTIGILGGGQLGRMLADAAAKLGLDAIIFCPEADTPAARTAARHWEGAFNDDEALSAFARACDVVTLEWENVPVAAAETVAATGTPMRPGAKALGVAQDRANEKRFLEACDIPVTPWRTVDSAEALQSALSDFGGRGILKTRREGYDGKGQLRLGAEADALDAFSALGGQPCILEAFAPFEREISVIVARTPDGETATWDVPENIHRGGILRRSQVPAAITPETAATAKAAAVRLVTTLDYIGVLALEFFVMEGGALLANEFAPRVHNSGHWTPEACRTGQFENHIRAVAGWPLGRTELVAPGVVMDNIIGELPLLADLPDGALTLYGKHEVRVGRKMGHIVRLTGL
ncbi:MAG: 5-(carboxyamino)imidazole ribonucleotide synthase [Pseudomonadota bacterium]